MWMTRRGMHTRIRRMEEAMGRRGESVWDQVEIAVKQPDDSNIIVFLLLCHCNLKHIK